MRQLLALLSFLFCISTAHADSLVVTTCGTLPLAYAPGATRLDTVDVNGNKCLGPVGGSGTTASQVQGNVASGVADAGNPVKVGGKFNNTLPTFVDGQRGDLQISAKGILIASGLGAGSGADATPNSSMAFGQDYASGGNRLLLIAGTIFNGTTWDRVRSINGALAAGTGTAAVAIAPSTAGGITPVVSASVEGSHVLKGSAGNFYSLVTTTGGTAGFVMVFNATSAPADGAVTPVECVVVAANSTVTINYNPGPPTAYATGITAVFSSTGCFTKTISATAFFSGKVS